jgi:asparagine N-glycosylation enzyme membrane subunit Stt3
MEQTVQTNEAAKRPTFLTVLCILSFIFSGLAIIGYITAIGLAGVASAAMSNLSDDAMATYTGPSVGLTWAYIVIGFITTLVGLFGVIKMWKLQKVGFYIYTACVVISIIMGIVYSGFGFMSILPLVFVVLYGLNLKAMK